MFIFAMTTVSDIIFLIDIYSYKLPKRMRTQLLVLLLALTISFIVIYDLFLIITTCFLLFKRSRSLKNEEEEEKFRIEKKWFWMHAANFVLMTITLPFEVFSWQEKIYLSRNTSVMVDLIKMFTAINLSIVFVMRTSVRAKIFNDFRGLKETFGVSITNLNMNVINRINVSRPI